MPQVLSMRQAEQYFGPPHSSLAQAEGTVLHEWVLDNTEQVPGQYVTQRIYLGHDRSGFREYYEREVWIPAHFVGQYCRISLLADAEGLVLHSAWQGNGCDAMLRGPAGL